MLFCLILISLIALRYYSNLIYNNYILILLNTTILISLFFLFLSMNSLSSLHLLSFRLPDRFFLLPLLLRLHLRLLCLLPYPSPPPPIWISDGNVGDVDDERSVLLEEANSDEFIRLKFFGSTNNKSRIRVDSNKEKTQGQSEEV